MHLFLSFMIRYLVDYNKVFLVPMHDTRKGRLIT